MDAHLFPLIVSFYTRDETLLLFLVGLALGLALLLASPGVRSAVRNTLAFSVLCFVGNFSAGLLVFSGLARAAAIVHGALLLCLGIALIRLLGLLLFRIVLPRLKLAPPSILEDLVLIFAYLAWGMLHLSHAGLDLSSIVATSAVITAVVAFAMQDTLGNILGGLVLQADNSIQIGDWVKVDDVSGQVVNIRWRFTAIRTRAGEMVVIPNSQLMKSKVWVMCDRESGQQAWRRTLQFNIGYVAQPARVIAIVEQALAVAEIPNVASSPPPSCVLLDFGPGYGRYGLRYWLTDPAQDEITDSTVRAHIYSATQRAGWRFAIPEELLHFTRENTAQRSETKLRELQRRIDALRSLPLFIHLSEEECRHVAEHLVYSPFAAGDVLTRQGAMAHWLYMIIAGKAEVSIETPQGERRVLARLGAGQFFGEMGLLTGEPRSATVTALTDMECYRLDKSGFEEIIQGRPEIAGEISSVLAARAEQNEMILHKTGQKTDSERHRDNSVIVARIRDFFNLG